jgi:hypothetical protein
LSAIYRRAYDSAAVDYWKQIFSRAWAETKKEFGSLSVKLVPAILVPFLQWREFGMGSVTSVAGLVEVAICVSEAYGIVFAVIYGAKLIAAGPTLLRERDDTIEQLKPKENQFRSKIQWMTIHQQQPGRFNVGLRLEIRSLNAAPTTMYDFELRAVGETNFSKPSGERMQVPTGALVERMFHLDISASRDDLAAFQIGGKWKMTFKDVHDNEHQTPVFQFVRN